MSRCGRLDSLSKVQRRLRVAIELVLRSMHEDLAERCLLSSPVQVRHFLRLWLRDQARECFVGLFLDAQHRLIQAEVLFQGSLNQTAVYPREVARRALELNAAALIVAHNHPSGVTEPSAADRLLTDSLKTTLRMLDIPVLDHLIVGDRQCFSFAEAGLI
jgi:DNA repair protein RadC